MSVFLGPKQPKIIAEAGINHQGDVEILKRLADTAFRAGSDFIKIQMRTPEICVPREQWEKPRVWKGRQMTYIEYKNDIELSVDELWEFDTYVRRNYGTLWDGASRWASSVWDIPSLERYSQFRTPFVKIPSAMITNKSLMMAARDSFSNIVISTGMSTLDEIKNAVKMFDLDHDLSVLHCCSAYPCPDEDVNLAGLISLEELLYTVAEEKGHIDQLPKWRVGFSSHSVSPLPAVYSVVLGAEIVEAHLTLDRAMEGSDHAASLEEPGLALLCREAKRIPLLWGEKYLGVQDSELEKRKSLRGV